MKTLIEQIEGLKHDGEIENYDHGYNKALREVIELLQSHPVIHAKGLRDKQTGKWYITIWDDREDEYGFLLKDKNHLLESMITFTDGLNCYPDDSEIVEFIILEK